MDTQKDSLKGLPGGVVLSAVFDQELGTLNILALYSPGVTERSGTLEHMVRWVVALHICNGGQRVYSALAFRSLGGGCVDDLHLKAFCGSSELYAAEKNHLLQGLGLAEESDLIHHDGWDQLQRRVRPVENEIKDFTSSLSFFDDGLARKCAAARAALLASKRK
jgi:hypothetical protein